MFDAHCHLDLHSDPAADVWQRAQSKGVEQAVLAGVDPSGWSAQRQLCETLPGLYRTAGLHPWTAARMPKTELIHALDALEVEFNRGGVDLVGIGELGLDRSRRLKHRGGWNMDTQIQAFESQLKMAMKRNLPLVLHIVDAHGPALAVAETIGTPSAGGMIHSFSGSAEIARKWLDRGISISISPQIQNSHAQRLRALVRTLPSDRLLVETDSPDQATSPEQVKDVIRTLASLRGEDPGELARQTAQNARRLFGLSSIA